MSRMVWGFLDCPARLVSFGDEVTYSVLNMLYLRKPQREVCIGDINLGVTDVEITEVIGIVR